MIAPEIQREIEALIHAEARALDEGRFADWLAFFAADGVYWVPGQPSQAAPDAAASIYYEHKPLLELRIRRLGEASLHATIPRTHHQVAAIEVVAGSSPGIEFDARSALIVAEHTRGLAGDWQENATRWYAARVLHRLRRDGAAWRIVLKRVDLIDCDAPHRALVVPF